MFRAQMPSEDDVLDRIVGVVDSSVPPVTPFVAAVSIPGSSTTHSQLSGLLRLVEAARRIGPFLLAVRRGQRKNGDVVHDAAAEFVKQ
jgi:hypothetical protein